MDPTLWNLLHDGKIERIDGALPGDLSLSVSIGYLRKRFPGAGTGFVVHLSGCSQFTFMPYDGPAIPDIASTATLAPEILSAEPGDPLRLFCAEGILALRYGTATLSLDSGEAITLSQLQAAAAGYWDEWSARAEAARQAGR